MAGRLRALLSDVPAGEGEGQPKGELAAQDRRWRAGITAGVLLCVVVILLGGELAAAAVRREIDRRLVAAGAGANAGMLSVEADQLSLLREITFTSGVGRALARGDAKALNRLVTPLQTNSSVPMVDLVLPDGQVVFAVRSRGAPPPVAHLRGLPVIAEAVAGAHGARGGRSSEVAVQQGQPILVTAGPALSGTTAVGAVLVMTPLADVLGLLSTQSGATITAYQATGQAEATTAPAAPPAVPPGEAAALFGGSAVETREDPGEVREMLGRLVVDHEPAALLGVSLPDDSFGAAVDVDLSSAGAVILGAGALVAIGRYRRILAAR